MSMKKPAAKSADKLVSTNKASVMVGLTPRQFTRSAKAAGLRVVLFPGLSPKYYASQVARMAAEARGEAVA